MPIVSAISEFMEKSRNLCNRLRSPEAVNVSTADLNLLREQLKVLDSQVGHVLEQKNNGRVTNTKPLTTPPSTRFS
jgi:hypothetical protein